MKGYEVKIIEASKELSARERIALKNFDDMVQLDDAITSDSPRLHIDIDG